MRKFFISSNNYHKMVIISFCILFLLPVEVLVLWILSVSIVLILFKKNKVLVKDALPNSPNIVISPVTGTIRRIKSEGNKIKYYISLSPIGNFGLYFPFSSTVDRVEVCYGEKESEQKKAPRALDKVQLSFVNRTGSRVGINIYRSLISGKPHIWPKVGDKGRVSANFGFLPFGGAIEVVISSDSNQLVTKGDKVLSGSTPLAGFKENNDER